MEEIKALLKALVASNSTDDKEDEKDKDKMEDKKEAQNEDVDKRKLIDEVAGIMKSAGADDELIRTAIKKMEKLGYDKSEAGTADNKCHNEEDPRDAKKGEGEDEDDKKVAAKNSIDSQINAFVGNKVVASTGYISERKAIELGKELY